MTMKQRYKKRPTGNISDVEYLMTQGFSQPIAEALSAREITADNFETFFGDELCFHDALEMAHMDEAVETINYLMESGGSVLIYGDYDADGVSASSLLSLYFSDNGIDNDVIIPLRSAGYGVHVEYVLKAFVSSYFVHSTGLDENTALDDGNLVGKGTHDSLLENCEVYQEIYYSQFPKEESANA